MHCVLSVISSVMFFSPFACNLCCLEDFGDPLAFVLLFEVNYLVIRVMQTVVVEKQFYYLCIKERRCLSSPLAVRVPRI